METSSRREPVKRQFRAYRELSEPAGSAIIDQVVSQRRRLSERLAGIRYVIPIASGKGGVGKSAITANLAVALSLRGFRVGAVDADLNGPSLAGMLGGSNGSLRIDGNGIIPADGVAGVRFVSMDLLLEASDTPLRWRGPSEDEFLWRGSLETGALREFLSDIAWGELDYLFIDVPPGTDRIQRVLELIPQPSAVILVTTPSAAAKRVVAKSARLLSTAGIQRVGVVTNMAGCECPHCGGFLPLFDGAGADQTVAGVQFENWAVVPFETHLASATDSGRPLALGDSSSPAALALCALADRLVTECPP